MGGRLSVDGIGITLIVLSSAALEIALDRGQIEDWFGSAFICWLLGIAVVGWVSTVVWELNSRYPVIDFRSCRIATSQLRALCSLCLESGYSEQQYSFLRSCNLSTVTRRQMLD